MQPVHSLYHDQLRQDWSAEKRVAFNHACRTLAGYGDMHINAYSLSPDTYFEVVAHTLVDGGQLAITCLAHDTYDLGDCEVRIDTTHKAPEFHADITAASTHSLGQLQWIGFEGHFRHAVLHVDSVHVHHYGAAQTFKTIELAPAARALSPVAHDPISAREVVGRFSTTQLEQLIDAACLGIIPGGCVPISHYAQCSHLGNNVFVTDICDTGITLLRTLKHTYTSVHIAFPKPARTLQDLASAVETLVTQASTHKASTH